MAQMIAYKLGNSSKVYHTTEQGFDNLLAKHGAGSVKMVGKVDTTVAKATPIPAKVAKPVPVKPKTATLKREVKKGPEPNKAKPIPAPGKNFKSNTTP